MKLAHVYHYHGSVCLLRFFVVVLFILFHSNVGVINVLQTLHYNGPPLYIQVREYTH
jgi:hypothetical protein